MTDSLNVGTLETRTVTVDRDRTIDFMGEDCRVYSTPALLQDIEHTCRDLIHSRVPKGQDSVGTKVSITHMAPTPIGLDVTITVTVAEIDGRRVVLEIKAEDSMETICSGRHERFIVDTAKTADRLRKKKAAAPAES